MSKYCGYIGFSQSVEVRDGVWEDRIVEKMYKGELTRNYLTSNTPSKIVDDISISNVVSIVGNKFAQIHMAHIKYVTLFGNKFKVISIDDSQPPRMLLYLGGEYNE